MPTWDPGQYERYGRYRGRAAEDLLAHIPESLDPREVWDLGCGSGAEAAALAARYPKAKVRGLDSSPEMLAAARERSEAVEWVLADVDDFTPPAPCDLIFTNAALQWVGDHARLFPRLADALASGGVLACQMPVASEAPRHVVLRETAADGPWAARLKDVGLRALAKPEDYYDWLSPLCDDVDIWTTDYLHVLTGEDPVVEWMKGTGLRPYLDRLPDPAEREAFLAAYRRRIDVVLPRRGDGATLLPFERLFIIARRAAAAPRRSRPVPPGSGGGEGR
jgi:trans-aconitate 2-methyltransferase